MPLFSSRIYVPNIPPYRHLAPTAVPITTAKNHSSSNASMRTITVATRSIGSSATDGSPVNLVSQTDGRIAMSHGNDNNFVGSILVTNGTGSITFTIRFKLNGVTLYTRSVTSSATTVYTSVFPQGLFGDMVGDIVIESEVTANSRTACDMTLYDLAIYPVDLT